MEVMKFSVRPEKLINGIQLYVGYFGFFLNTIHKKFIGEFISPQLDDDYKLFVFFQAGFFKTFSFKKLLQSNNMQYNIYKSGRYLKKNMFSVY